MRCRCDFCGNVDNITSSPNNIEGVFIPENIYEIYFSIFPLGIESKKNPEMDLREIGDWANRCTECGNMTVISKAKERIKKKDFPGGYVMPDALKEMIDEKA